METTRDDVPDIKKDKSKDILGLTSILLLTGGVLSYSLSHSFPILVDAMYYLDTPIENLKYYFSK